MSHELQRFITTPSYTFDTNEHDLPLYMLLDYVSIEILRILANIESPDAIPEINIWQFQLTFIRDSFILNSISSLKHLLDEFKKAVDDKIETMMIQNRVSNKMKHRMKIILEENMDKIELLYQDYYGLGRMMFMEMPESHILLENALECMDIILTEYNGITSGNLIASMVAFKRRLYYSFYYDISNIFNDIMHLHRILKFLVDFTVLNENDETIQTLNTELAAVTTSTLTKFMVVTQFIFKYNDIEWDVGDGNYCRVVGFDLGHQKYVGRLGNNTEILINADDVSSELECDSEDFVTPSFL